MQPRAFETFFAEHDQVRAGLERAARAAPAKDYGTVIDMAALVLLFPLVRFLLIDIGLPWLATLKRYSEVQRRRVEDWIDAEALSHGLDPDALEAESRALMQELEQTTGHRRRRHPRLRRAPGRRRGQHRRCAGRAPRPFPGRLAGLRPGPGLRRRAAAHPRAADVLSGVRRCACVAAHGPTRRRLVPARAARPWVHWATTTIISTVLAAARSSASCAPRRPTCSRPGGSPGGTGFGTASSAPCRGWISSTTTPAVAPSGRRWSLRSCPTLVADDDGPRPGRDDQWGLVTDYRVRLAREDRDWAEAERLQRRRVDWDRERAAPLLERPVEGLDGEVRHRLRTLAVSLSGLAGIQREQERPSHFQQAIRLYEAAGNLYAAAQTRANVAVALLQANRHADALDYARAALQGFQRYGEQAQRDIDKVQALIRDIEAAAQDRT